MSWSPWFLYWNLWTRQMSIASSLTCVILNDRIGIWNDVQTFPFFLLIIRIFLWSSVGNSIKLRLILFSSNFWNRKTTSLLDYEFLFDLFWVFSNFNFKIWNVRTWMSFGEFWDTVFSCLSQTSFLVGIMAWSFAGYCESFGFKWRRSKIASS